MKRTLKLLGLSLSATMLLAACGQGGAGGDAGYPNGNVRILVSHTAGGPTDLAARAIAPCLEDELGGTFIVENNAGGSGAIAMNEVAKSAPDGKTLTIYAVGNAIIAPMLAPDVGYDHTDFTPLGRIYELPSVLTVADSSPYATAEEFFAKAAGSPGALKVATPGSKVYDAELQRMAQLYDVELTTVPFEGTSDAVTALLGNNVDAMFSDAGQAVLSQIEAGTFRALATGAAEPVSFLEDVPTLSSLGYEELTLTSNPFALAGPKGLEPDVADKLAGAMETCSTRDSVAKLYGEQYKPESFTTGEEVSARSEEIAKSFKPFLTK